MYSKINNFYKNNNLSSNSIYNKSKTNNLSSTISMRKSVQGLLSKPLQELSFKGNIIDIKNGCNYKAKTLMHGNAEISVNGNTSELLLYQQYPNKDITTLFSQDEFIDIAKTNDIVGFLSSGKSTEKIVDLIRTFMPDIKDVAARLQTLGIEPGKTFEIKGNSEKLFLDTSGALYTATEVEHLRNVYNTNDFSKMGYTKKSVFTIDGQDFHLDDTGHLNIPEGTICTPSRVSIKK